MYCMNGVILVAFILNAAVTYAAGVYGYFGETNASQSEAFPTLVTPATWSFSIWGVIFVGEGLFALAQLCTRRFTYAEKDEVRTIAPWFLSVCVCQALWAVAFAQPLASEGQSTWAVWLSLALMLALWVSLYCPPPPPRTAGKPAVVRPGTCLRLSRPRPSPLRLAAARGSAAVAAGRHFLRGAAAKLESLGPIPPAVPAPRGLGHRCTRHQRQCRSRFRCGARRARRPRALRCRRIAGVHGIAPHTSANPGNCPCLPATGACPLSLAP